MIKRSLKDILHKRIDTVPVVALLGSRQVGKTTMAKGLRLKKKNRYLDLELPSDRAKLNDPELYLSSCENELVILDEVQTMPELFPVLRSLVDQRRQKGEKAGHFLLLGSASPELLQKSSETLAGRISYLELNPLNLKEIKNKENEINQLWLRGGYPDSFLAEDLSISIQWRNDFVTSYVERFIPNLGLTKSTPIELRRLCSMLAYQHGGILNYASLSRSLGIDAKTVRKYIELLEGLYLTRTLHPWAKNVGKRLVKAPKFFWRDTGILHALTNLKSVEDVLGNPLCGASWEGFCIEQIITSLPEHAKSFHYRTHAGAELDLIIELPGKDIIAVEIKRSLSPKVTPAMMESFETTEAKRGFIVTPKGEGFPMNKYFTALPISEFISLIEKF
ncbi:MAG: ATP-binding protein [Opitutae bacterium]|jgi:predicted AAA+ superfamily ATPase|nr:ATP-binding protein [Opitutae bacterium]MBT7404498.1 ATP-binding protein [Opitutae bacterium]